MGILLVDDDPKVQELVESTLQKSGLSVISVNDGLSALDIAISETPDLILADFLIKGIDISTFVKKIQRRPALANTPIVLLMQGGLDSDSIAHSLTETCAILKKPLDPIFLYKEVKKQIGIIELELPEEEELSFLPIADDLLSEAPLYAEACSPKIEPVLTDAPKVPSPVVAPVSGDPEKTAFKADIDPERVNEAIQKIVLEVVERVAWEIIPSVVEMAMSKTKIQSFVEQAVWEIVPPLAEIEIKKEIKRLQPDEGFSA